MSIPKKYYERHSLATSLQTYLGTTSWQDSGGNDIQVREGFQSELPIRPPLIAVHFLPSNYLELQMGRSPSEDKTMVRRLQIDCYMETEPRAMSITDDIADFIDQMFINIVDPLGATLGHLYCPDSETIISDMLTPRMSDPTSLRWRGIVTATLEADYIT